MTDPCNISNIYAGARTAYITKSFSVDSRLRALDFHLRFSSMLTATALAATGQHPHLHACPGFGTHISYLKKAAGLLRPAGFSPIGTLAAELASGVTQNLPGHATPNIKLLRDHLFHGGTVPEGAKGEAIATTLDKVEQAAGEAVVSLLASSICSSEGQRLLLRVHRRSDEIDLSPLVLLSDGKLEVLSRLNSRGAQYLCPGAPEPRRTTNDPETISRMRGLVDSTEQDRALADMVEWVKEDVLTFANPDREVLHTVEDGVVTVYWSHQDSSGDVERDDEFRLAKADEKQWRFEGSWKPYPQFLQALANWRVTAERLRQSLSRNVVELGHRGGVLPVRAVKTNIDLAPTRDSTGEVESTALDIVHLADDAVERNRATTKVIFLAGEAGIGKTVCLLSAAVDRAREVEQNPHVDAPLYLYVSSAGNALARLDTVVAEAVGRTRNLTSDSVKALCRNGLMVVLIDGFDELLGGSTYKDALGSLRPWIQRLGGRGVLVVSARSSYYLQQYRRSIDENLDSLAVSHEFARLRRWNDDELSQYMATSDVPPVAWRSLDRSDVDLLKLPFYASEFSKWWHSGPRSSSSLGVRDILVGRFVSREVAKLALPGAEAQVLMSEGEFRSASANLAELMADRDEREVGLDDLRLAVADALSEGDIDDRRGLRERLEVLCLVNASGSAQDRRFRFEHELYFDIFLGEALLRYLSASVRPTFWRIVGRVALRRGTIDVLAREPARLSQTLESAAETDSSILQHNLGRLWEALVKQRVLPTQVVVGASFGSLQLPGGGSDSLLRLNRCTIDRLEVPANSGMRLQLEDCVVKNLEIVAGGQLPALELLGGTRVDSIQTPAEYQDTPAGVRGILAEQGLAEGPASEKGISEAFEYFLTRIAARAEVSVVIQKSTLLVEDPRLNWTRAYGEDAWCSFVRALDSSGLARLEAFPGSGPAKLRLQFSRGPSLILSEIGKEEGADSFWARARSG